jgi:hypothetical protein
MHYVQIHSLLQVVVKHHCKLSHVRKDGQWCRNMKTRIGANSSSMGTRGLQKGLKRKKSILVISCRLKETGNFPQWEANPVDIMTGQHSGNVAEGHTSVG